MLCWEIVSLPQLKLLGIVALQQGRLALSSISKPYRLKIKKTLIVCVVKDCELSFRGVEWYTYVWSSIRMKDQSLLRQSFAVKLANTIVCL